VQPVKKIIRNLRLKMLASTSAGQVMALGEKKYLKTFLQASNQTKCLKELFQEQRIEPNRVKTLEDIAQSGLILNKQNTFERFSLNDLCVSKKLVDIKSVLTSSGHSGRFAFGLSTHKQVKQTPDLIDTALQHAFQIDQKKTLLVNCLPMGVRFPSDVVTLAETSVREDMALALIKKFSVLHDQVIMTCDPLFLKLFLDVAKDQKINWQNIHMNLIIGEETFGENFRNYVAGELTVDPDDPTTGLIGSSMGAGELGLNLGFETVETIKIRRLAFANPNLARNLFGASAPLPMLFCFNPLNHFMEIHQPAEDGFGKLLVSLLDTETPLPLVRYETGDEAKIIMPSDVEAICQAMGISVPDMPNLPMMAIRGRDKDLLNNGVHLSTVKDSLYADAALAHNISGAFRIRQDEQDKIHIQLKRGADTSKVIAPTLSYQGQQIFAPDQIKLWSYDNFPFGKTIDYERKFSYLD